ncbi:TRAP transporter large permease subunit [Brevibacterium luteolum]|uniref:TRAP transporter large permease subunit n=1 Tax=Brevibacterium luteolum TaxID=199591 RepID=UPI00223BDD1B|nr:TRAP transporter large permease subunit [Brevibacterium luteolum]
MRADRVAWGPRLRSIARAVPPAGAAVIILGGILSGITTPTEASALGVAYVAMLALVYRNLSWTSVSTTAEF